MCGRLRVSVCGRKWNREWPRARHLVIVVPLDGPGGRTLREGGWNLKNGFRERGMCEWRIRAMVSTMGDIGVRPRLYRSPPDPRKVNVLVLGAPKYEWHVERSEAKFQTYRLVCVTALTVCLIDIGLGA